MDMFIFGFQFPD